MYLHWWCHLKSWCAKEYPVSQCQIFWQFRIKDLKFWEEDQYDPHIGTYLTLCHLIYKLNLHTGPSGIKELVFFKLCVNFGGHCFLPWKSDFFLPKVTFLFLNVPFLGVLPLAWNFNPGISLKMSEISWDNLFAAHNYGHFLYFEPHICLKRDNRQKVLGMTSFSLSIARITEIYDNLSKLWVGLRLFTASYGILKIPGLDFWKSRDRSLLEIFTVFINI